MTPFIFTHTAFLKCYQTLLCACVLVWGNCVQLSRQPDSALSINSCAWLSHLDLSYNKFTMFPNFSALKALQTLILSHNNLSSFNDEG